MRNITTVNEPAAPALPDLNLLRVFDALWQQRSVSRAAESLGLTQPAVSNALARLRAQLGDALFLRTPAGMQPTPRAADFAAAVGPALVTIRSAWARGGAFDAVDAERRFSIGMTDIGEIYFLPRLMRHLAAAAPGVALSTVRNTAVRLKEELEAGAVDLAIGLLPQLEAGFHRRLLFNQRYVCLLRAGHVLAARPITRAAYTAAEHLSVVAAGTGHGQIDDWLARHRVVRRVRLQVPHFVAIGHILADSDLVATVPERLAERLAEPFGLLARAHPFTLPPVTISLYWHARVNQDGANRWLREQVVALFADPRGVAAAR